MAPVCLVPAEGAESLGQAPLEVRDRRRVRDLRALREDGAQEHHQPQSAPLSHLSANSGGVVERKRDPLSDPLIANSSVAVARAEHASLGEANNGGVRGRAD